MRSARRGGSRPPSRRRRPRAGRRRPRSRAGRADRSSGQSSSAESRSTAIRFRSSGIDRSKLRSPASTWAIGTSPAASRAGERRVRVAVDEHPVGPLAPRPPRGSRGSSPPGRRCGGRAGSGARRARARRRRPATARGRSAAPCAARPRRSRPRAARADSGADLMNCGRLPTTESTRIAARLRAPCGPLAQLVEQGTLNPKVEGSNPSRPMCRVTCVSPRFEPVAVGNAKNDQDTLSPMWSSSRAFTPATGCNGPAGFCGSAPQSPKATDQTSTHAFDLHSSHVLVVHDALVWRLGRSDRQNGRTTAASSGSCTKERRTVHGHS